MSEIVSKFFTRDGGVSEGIYRGLNCGAGSNDAPDAVQENLRRVCAELGCAADRLVLLHQIHSAECVIVDEPWSMDARPNADACVTDKPNIALGVLTADCTPVLFEGRKSDGSPVIGAAHAGWKGAIGGVLDSVVEAMTSLGARDISAQIGPCIAQSSYEVQDSFADPFLEREEAAENFFMAGQRAGHLQFDIAGYCAFRLAGAGVRNVKLSDIDTYANEDAYFSYRRTTHRGEPDYGRQISAILIKEG